MQLQLSWKQLSMSVGAATWAVNRHLNAPSCPPLPIPGKDLERLEGHLFAVLGRTNLQHMGEWESKTDRDNAIVDVALDKQDSHQLLTCLRTAYEDLEHDPIDMEILLTCNKNELHELVDLVAQLV